ncbi:prolipoprotein diacylglyceryl transferase [Aciduricibacillus chroicocephali]|uniref:Phosphatidylglycerol--prolipoprotein diacylglyceryl transferase n=1 Tax=Aciduricibacillus chroicocephali TaxID=3054939 RepID=A0ABY9KWG5_9BACI|nr:prolipoprotein diacylglyceryl transferase [Bacillaceae bacterium 44XB]
MSCSAPHLDRVFIQIGSLPIYWYGVIIAAGVFIGLFLAQREAAKQNLEKDSIIDLVILAVPVSIIFARIYYVLFEWDAYVGGPWWKWFAVWEGGIAIHGALIGATLTAIVYTRVKGISFWKMADILAPSLILGQAIGRWGNFMNQEAHGGPMSKAAYENFHQYLPDFIMNQMCIDGVTYYPTFLYESVWDLIVFGLLLLIRKKNPLRGEVFLSYMMLYSVGRYFIEGLRTDSLYIIPGVVRIAQVVSLLLIVAAILILIYRRRSGLANVRYNGEPRQEK